MTSRTQPSFSVKSSHRLVNPDNEPEQLTTQSFLYGNTNVTTVLTTPKGGVDTDPKRKEGSAKGMCIRTTSTGTEDYY